MKKSIHFLAMAMFLMCVPSGKADGAKEYAPEIKEYIEKTKQERKEKEKEQKKERRADPYRKLRPYQTLSEVYADLDEAVSANSGLFTGGTYGTSVGGRELRWVRLSTGPGDKPEILVSGNIHAQELAGGQMVMALIDFFAKGYGEDCRATAIADAADIYFIPVLNPDGMAKVARMQSRWGFTGFVRKNLDKVDLNRNFPYPPDGPEKLKDSAGSPRRFSQTHRGAEPLSEPETAALDRFVAAHDFLLSLNYHTSGGLILFVPGTYPEWEADSDLMEKMAEAYREKQFDKYRVNPAIDLYPTLGALDDYLYHRYGILAFTVEVGTNMYKRGWIIRNGAFSPVFWSYNVYYLEREKANNVPGALAMIEYAVKVRHNPEMLEWTPPEQRWVGEPPLEGIGEKRASDILRPGASFAK